MATAPRCRCGVPPTDGADGDVRRPAGRAVAEAGDGAVVAGRWCQTRNCQDVGGGGQRLTGLKEQKLKSSEPLLPASVALIKSV